MTNGTISKGRSPMRIIALLLGAFVLLILLCILAMPTLFSTALGTKILIQMVESRAKVILSVEELSLQWFSAQKVTGLRVESKVESAVFVCKEITTDAPLWQILMQNKIGDLTLSAPGLKISKPFLKPSAMINLPKMYAAGFAAAPQAMIAMPEGINGRIAITEGRIELSPPEMAPIVFDKLTLSLDLASKEEAALKLHALTSQQQMQGEISLEAQANHLGSALPSVNMHASIAQLPVQGIDQIASLFFPEGSGLLLSAIGPSLNIDANLSAAQGNFDLNFNARSEGVTAQVSAQTLNGMLSLKTPASLNFNLKPETLKLLAKIYPEIEPLALQGPALLQCALTQFQSALPFNWNKSAFSFSILPPPQMLLTIRNKPFSLSALAFNAISPSFDQGATFSLKGTFGFGASQSPFAIDAGINQPNPDGNTGNLAFIFSQFPTDFASGWVDAPLTLALGQKLDFSGNIIVNPNGSKAKCTLKSDQIDIPSIDLSFGDAITLISPCSFKYVVTPEISSRWIGQSAWKQIQSNPFDGMLQNLVLPTKNVAKSNIDLTLSTANFNFSGPAPFNIPELKARLVVNGFNAISLAINGSPIEAFIAGALNPVNQEFVLNKPFVAQMKVDPALLKALVPSAPVIAQPATIQCQIDPFALRWKALSLETLKLGGKFTLDALDLTLPGKVALKNAILPFQWDGKGKTASLELTASVQNPTGNPGTIQGQASCSRFQLAPQVDFQGASINLSLDFQNIDSTFAEAMTSTTGMNALIGPAFSGKCKIQSTPEKQNLSLNWTSPYLNFNTAFLIDDQAVHLQGVNAQIVWILTPEGYQMIDRILSKDKKGMVPFELQEASTFKIFLEKLNLPLSSKEKKGSLLDRIPQTTVDFSQLQAILNVHSNKLTFFDKTSQELIELTTFSTAIEKNSGVSPLLFNVDCAVETRNPKMKSGSSPKTGKITLTEKLTSFYDAQGNFDFSKLTSNTTLTIQQFPTRLLDIFARARGRTDFPFSTLFGDVVGASFYANVKDFTGPVTFNLYAPNARASLTGNVVNGALLLDESIHAQLKVTAEVSRLVLREVNPLNLSYIYSSDPVTLEILPKGFYLPFFPFNLSKVAVPEVHIELGKITCRNEGNVGVTLGLLKSKQFDKNKDLTLWFAPMDLHIQKGNVDVERTEILIADTFDIAMWGKVDLVKDYVNMVLGLTAQTLYKAFGVKNLPDDYVLTLPMRGKMDNVQIDTSKATAKVALLLAWQQAESLGGLGGGPAGAMVGGLLNKMATLPDKDVKVPPAKHPFPWEGGRKKRKETSDNSHEKKKHFKQNDKPLKQLIKVLR